MRLPNRIAWPSSFLRISLTLFCVMLFNRCSYERGEIYRGVGFKIEAGQPIQIYERLRYKEKTMYVTPEGEHTSVSYQRLGLYVDSAGGRVNIPFLDHRFQYLMLPMHGSPYWLGIKMAQEVAYPPRPDYYDKVLVFSLEQGVLLDLNVEDHDVFFPRGTETLWFRMHGESMVQYLRASGDDIEWGVASVADARAFQEGVLCGVDLINSLRFFDLNSLSGAVKGRQLFEGSSNVLFYGLSSDYSKGLVGQFMYGANRSSLKCVHQTEARVVLENLAMFADEMLWYYVDDMSGPVVNGVLKSAPIGTCGI